MDKFTQKIVSQSHLCGIIRLTKNEYPKTLPRRLTIFVVSPTTTRTGKYLLPKILKFIDVRKKIKGGKVNTFPRLSFHNIFYGEVFKVTDELDISGLKKKDFKFSLEKIKSPHSLLEAIKRKYKVTRPGLDFSKVKVSKIEIRNLKYFEYSK